MSDTPTDRIQVPPAALLAHDHILGLVVAGSYDIAEETDWRVEHRTVKYAGSGDDVHRVVVADCTEPDGSTCVHEFEDAAPWLWVAFPRAEAQPPVHAVVEAA